MTMRERLNVHREIERKNKEQIDEMKEGAATVKTYKVWALYRDFVYHGFYLENEKHLAKLWAKENGGTIKLETRQYIG